MITHGSDWAGKLARSSTANSDDYAAKPIRNAFDEKALGIVQEKLDAFSKDNEDHGIQFVAGDATTGEQVVKSAGCSKKNCGERVNSKSIFRLASMTKIMGASKPTNLSIVPGTYIECARGHCTDRQKWGASTNVASCSLSATYLRVRSFGIHGILTCALH